MRTTPLLKGVRNVYNLKEATSACEKDGQWQRMAPSLTDMRQEALSLNVIRFHAATPVWETCGQWQCMTHESHE
eukprot:10612231-Karenia_brevis.AAC.1